MSFRTFLLLATSAAFLLYLGVPLSKAASEDLISFPYQNKPCNCFLTACACCQGIVVNPINVEKRLCLNYTLYVIPLKVDFKIVLDNSVMADFSINPNTPPNYCIPVPLPDLAGMCVKISELKILPGNALKICSVFYVNYKTDKFFDHQFPCVKIGMDGFSLMRR